MNSNDLVNLLQKKPKICFVYSKNWLYNLEKSSSRSFLMILVSFGSSQWDEDGFCNNFQIKNFKRNLKFDDSDL